ncbi:MAG: hypothetical protein K6A38_01210 [Lachnospiraceae bacterium]|nr:hypothetical protein [Lachnospiraceae bacterium]
MKKFLLGLCAGLAVFTVYVMGAVSTTAASTSDSNAISSGTSAAVIIGGNVVVSATYPTAPASDDGQLYLYELKTYEYAIPDGAQPVATVATSTNPVATIPLNYSSGAGRLYNKFVFCANRGGVLTMVNNAQYIQNPEAVATKAKPRVARPVKCFQEGNVASINLNGTGTDNPYYNVLHGVFYVDNIDSPCADPTAKSADSHPIKRNPINQYMLNANDEAGVNGLIADMVNYATNSNIQDYVIGNEVNERCWNYMAYTDWDTYMRKYVQVFRVCYTAIKSVNPNARVYVSIDQVWDKNENSYEYIDGLDFMNKFNTLIRQGGNLDWDMAIHPYPNPLYYPKFWDMSGVANGKKFSQQVAKDQVLTFQNLSIVTNMLQQPTYLNRGGQVRDVIISEIGMGSNAGEQAQAAGLAAAWAAFERNPYITQFMYLEYDVNGFFPTLKGKSLEVWNALGTDKEAEIMDWAKGVIGVKDWSEVLR